VRTPIARHLPSRCPCGAAAGAHRSGIVRAHDHVELPPIKKIIVDTRDKLLVTRRDVEPTNAIARALRPA